MSADYYPEHRQFGAGCTGCDWVSTDPRKSLRVAHAEHAAAVTEPPTLADVILRALRECWREDYSAQTVAEGIAAAVEQHHADEKALRDLKDPS